MATLTISIGALSASRTITAAHQTRLQDAATVRLQEQGITSPSNQQVIDYIMDRLKADLVTMVRQVEQQQADAGVTSIAIT